MVFQNQLYKNRDGFYAEVNKIPVRYTAKTSLVIKIKQAIEYKIPTVALALYNLAKNYNEAVIEKDLQETLKLCKLPTDATFLRKAFGEPDTTNIQQLGELFYYLVKIGEPYDYITDTILSKFGETSDLKYSDFLNLSMMVKKQELRAQDIEDIRDQLDVFSGTVIYNYLLSYAENIHDSGVFPDEFKREFKEHYKYFAEGIKKWAFIDKEVEPELREDVRSLALKANYKYITLLGNKKMLEKLIELSEYISSTYLFTMNTYKFNF